MRTTLALLTTSYTAGVAYLIPGVTSPKELLEAQVSTSVSTVSHYADGPTVGESPDISGVIESTMAVSEPDSQYAQLKSTGSHATESESWLPFLSESGDGRRLPIRGNSGSSIVSVETIRIGSSISHGLPNSQQELNSPLEASRDTTYERGDNSSPERSVARGHHPHIPSTMGLTSDEYERIRLWYGLRRTDRAAKEEEAPSNEEAKGEKNVIEARYDSADASSDGDHGDGVGTERAPKIQKAMFRDGAKAGMKKARNRKNAKKDIGKPLPNPLFDVLVWNANAGSDDEDGYRFGAGKTADMEEAMLCEGTKVGMKKAFADGKYVKKDVVWQPLYTGYEMFVPKGATMEFGASDEGGQDARALNSSYMSESSGRDSLNGRAERALKQWFGLRSR